MNACCHDVPLHNQERFNAVSAANSLFPNQKCPTPSLCHLNCCNCPAVSNRDKWSIYLGRWQAILLQGFRPWRLGFLKSCKYPLWLVFPGCWRSWESPFVILRLYLRSRARYSKVSRWCVLSVLSTHPPTCSNSLRECRKSRKRSFGVRAAVMHLQCVISAFSARLGFPV